MEQNDEQIMLEGFEPGKLQAICEVKSFSSKPGSYTAAFVFNEDEVAIDQLKEFQFTDIKIQAELVGEADPDDEDEDTDDLFDEDEGEDGDEG